MQRLSVSSVLLVVFTVSMITGVFAPIFPAIQHEFALSAASMSLLLSVFGISRLVMDLPAGKLADSYSPVLLLTASAVLAVVGGLGAALAPAFPLLLGSRVFLGVGSAVSVVFGLAILARLSDRPDASMNYFYVAMFAGLVVSPVIGGFIGGAWGWRYAVAAVSIAALLAAVVIGRHLRPRDFRRTRVSGHDGHPTERLVRTTPVLTIYALSFVALALYTGAKLTLLPLYGAHWLGLGTAKLGLIFTATAALTPITMLAVARVSSSRRKVQLISGGLAMWILGLVLLLFPRLVTFLAASACFDLAGGLMYSTPYALLTDCIPRSASGQAMGETRLPADIAWLVVPPVIGAALDRRGPVLPLMMLMIVSTGALIAVQVFLSRGSLQRTVSEDLESGLGRT